MDLIEDSNSLIRSQVLRTLSEIGNAVPETIEILLLACKPELKGNQMGGAMKGDSNAIFPERH